MVQLIFWVALRGALAQLPAQSAVPQGGASLVAYDLDSVIQDIEPYDCSKALGGKDSTYWANWLILKGIGGGVQLPGMTKALPGMVEMALNVGKAGADVKARAGNAVRVANILARAVSLLMQLASMELVALQNPDRKSVV